MRRIDMKLVLCFLLVIVSSPMGWTEEGGTAPLEQFTYYGPNKTPN